MAQASAWWGIQEMIGITSCFRQWLTVVRLPRNHVKFTAERSYEYRSALHRNHKLLKPFSWTSMVFCSKYFFSGDFHLNQFVQNPARILAWYSFGEMGLFTFTTAKNWMDRFFTGQNRAKILECGPRARLVRSKYSAFICLHWFGSLPIPPASYQRIIRAGFGTNWLKPNENWTHDDPLRYSEKQVTDVHEKRVYQLTNSM